MDVCVCLVGADGRVVEEERHSPDTTARSAGFKSQAGWPPMDVVCCDIRVVSSRKREERGWA
jgi:hypothetical protein